jgi:hypothetical protein
MMKRYSPAIWIGAVVFGVFGITVIGGEVVQPAVEWPMILAGAVLLLAALGMFVLRTLSLLLGGVVGLLLVGQSFPEISGTGQAVAGSIVRMIGGLAAVAVAAIGLAPGLARSGSC